MNKLYLVYSGWRNRVTSPHSVGKAVHEVANPVTFVVMISIEALNWGLCVMTGKMLNEGCPLRKVETTLGRVQTSYCACYQYLISLE